MGAATERHRARVVFWLKASRPGLWFQTVWLYLLAAAGSDAHRHPAFWVGLLWATFPLNLLVYGWNDVIDADLDRNNPRKDSFLFGARGTPAELATLPGVIAAVNAPFFAYFLALAGLPMALALAGLLAANALYNLPRHGLRGRPPLELVNEAGALLVLVIGALVNGRPQPPWPTFAYLYLFTVHAHLIGEVMDYGPDRLGGRHTTATVIGARPTKALVAGLMLAEASLLLGVFHDRVLGACLLAGAAGVLVDLLVVYRGRPYGVGMMRLLGVAFNGAGYGTMLWVWVTGSLSRLP
jgi:4-hydroxybenzoate polyprenyltransferase